MGSHNRLPGDDALLKMVNGGRRPTDIARQYGVRHQTVYANLNRIEAERPGSVQRRRRFPVPVDPEVVEVVARERGIETASAVRAVQRKMRAIAPAPVVASVVERTPETFESIRQKALLVAELVKGGVTVKQAVDIVKRVA